MIAQYLPRLLLLVAGTGLLSSVAEANDIEPGKEFYTAIKAPQSIELDGDLAEWSGAQLLANPKFSIPKGSGDGGELVEFELNGGDWTGPEDQSSNVQVVYDDDNVYFGFIVTDEYHENSANSAWNGDSVQLMIANDARDTQVALYNYALGGVEGALGDVVILHEAGPGGTEAIITRDAEAMLTTYEIKLPKESLGLSELKGGVQFGLGMAINDGDEATPGQKGWGGLGAHALVFGKSPEETALVTLATANDIEPGKEFYFANPKPNDIVLDGDLSDWAKVPVLRDPRFAVPKGTGSRSAGAMLTLFELNGGDYTGSEDQSSEVQMVYDEDNVYCSFIVTDEYHENSAASAWNGDSIQLMIANDKQDTQVGLYNYALSGVEGALGDVIIMHEAGPGGTEAVITRNPETMKTHYEIKLPKESLGVSELELGTMFGIGMAINDGDESTPGQKGWGGLGAHALVFGKSPEETALVTLGVGVLGDLRPTLRGGPRLEISSSGEDIVLSWESQEGELFNVRSETNLAAGAPEVDSGTWPIYGGNQDIVATPPTNTLTVPRPDDLQRFFVVESFPAPPVVIYEEDFESGQGNWTTGSDGVAGTAWEFGSPSDVGPAAANSPPTCFGTNLSADYEVEADIWLRSPVIDLTAAGGATLRFFQFTDIELTFDAGRVAVLDAADLSELAVLDDAIDGVSGDWDEFSKSLPDEALGKNVIFEFRFTSDDFQSHAGWYVDDVVVTVP